MSEEKDGHHVGIVSDVDSVSGGYSGGHAPAKDRIVAAARDPWKHRSKGMLCSTCMFYVPKVANPESQCPSTIGRCRRNAPTMSGFPAVFPGDWCGEHKLDENRL